MNRRKRVVLKEGLRMGENGDRQTRLDWKKTVRVDRREEVGRSMEGVSAGVAGDVESSESEDGDFDQVNAMLAD